MLIDKEMTTLISYGHLIFTFLSQLRTSFFTVTLISAVFFKRLISPYHDERATLCMGSMHSHTPLKTKANEKQSFIIEKSMKIILT
jgi:hypothetical protein